MRVGVEKPPFTEKDGETPDGWYSIWYDARGHRRAFDSAPGFHSCTKPRGAWSVRIEWPKPGLALGGSAV